VLCEGQNCFIVFGVTNICKLSLYYTWGHELWCSVGRQQTAVKHR